MHGERDEEHQFGVTIPYRGWWFDAAYYNTKARNFLDHEALGASSIFFPVTIGNARIRGVDVSLNSPRIAKRLRFSLIYARMRAEGWGGISGGLTEAGHSEDTLSGDPAATKPAPWEASRSLRTHGDDERTQEVGQLRSTNEVCEQTDPKQAPVLTFEAKPS
jgi:hypothetical protein